MDEGGAGVGVECAVAGALRLSLGVGEGERLPRGEGVAAPPGEGVAGAVGALLREARPVDDAPPVGEGEVDGEGVNRAPVCVGAGVPLAALDAVAGAEAAGDEVGAREAAGVAEPQPRVALPLGDEEDAPLVVDDPVPFAEPVRGAVAIALPDAGAVAVAVTNAGEAVAAPALGEPLRDAGAGLPVPRPLAVAVGDGVPHAVGSPRENEGAALAVGQPDALLPPPLPVGGAPLREPAPVAEAPPRGEALSVGEPLTVAAAAGGEGLRGALPLAPAALAVGGPLL